jgi:hypothetical protein
VRSAQYAKKKLMSLVFVLVMDAQGERALANVHLVAKSDI